MNIVGPQSVSMSDLMKLGPAMLNAMAQGRTKSIAPPYMVLAALKAVTDMEAGAQQAVPQATVKDQVVAQAAPAGIAQMVPQQQPPQQPVQKFAGGSTDNPALQAEYVLEGYYPERQYENSKPKTIGEIVNAYKAWKDHQALLDAVRRQRVAEAEAWTEDKRVGTERGRSTETRAVESPVYKPPVSAVAPAAAVAGVPAAAVTAAQPAAAPAAVPPQAVNPAGLSAWIAARDVGIGSNAKKPTLVQPSLAIVPEKVDKIAAPTNAALAGLIKEYGTPDEKRAAELKQAERTAMLAALARGIASTKNGRGLGAVFGPAAADAVEAREARADKRREYEDQRKLMFDKLRMMGGQEAVDNFWKETDANRAAQEAAFNRALGKTKLGVEAGHYSNQSAVEMYKAELAREGNFLTAAIRREGMSHERMLQFQDYLTKAKAVAQAEAQKTINPLGQPGKENEVNAEAERLYRQSVPKDVEKTFHDMTIRMFSGVGGFVPPAAATTAATASTKAAGRMPN